MNDFYFEEEEYQSQVDWAVWRKIAHRMRDYRGRLIPLAIVSIVIAVTEVTIPYVTREIIDAAHLRGGEGIWNWVALNVGLAVCCAASIWLIIQLAGGTSIRMSTDIRAEAFQRIQELDFSYFDRRPVGWLMSRLTSDCQNMARVIAWGYLDLIWSSCMMIGIATWMLVMNWKVGLAILSVVPALIALSLWFQVRILKTSRKTRKANSRVTAGYNEGMLGARTTKSLVRESSNLNEFGGLTGNMFDVSVRNQLYTAAYLPLILLIGSVGTGLAIWHGGGATMAGDMTPGTLVAFIAFSGLFFQPALEMARVFSELQSVQANGERVLGLIDEEPKIRDNERVLERIRSATDNGSAIDGHADHIGELVFRNVTFTYEEGPTVLHDFNLTVRAGETVALVGPTGGGKSTIVNMACRFYEPTEGEICIDGLDYRERSLHWLHSNLGMMLQSPHLFSGTIRDNIRYGAPGASDEDVERAAALVQADEFISPMEEGYDSRVGEGGVNLSTGQKQLICLARAILADPRILVMDEATASVDTETEQMIQESIERVLENRISLVIAHRLSTIRNADRILFIDEGRIVEDGSHRELIAQQGRYYELYTQQFSTA